MRKKRSFFLNSQNLKNLFSFSWDGKPIPYWLYKLHGLNLSFSCEICGNQNYKGPKAFQKHFTVSPNFLPSNVEIAYQNNESS